MPYYQIKHLQALDDYLELLGARKISELSKGKGNPPWEDPQIFLGAISIDSPLPASFPLSTSIQSDHSNSFIIPGSSSSSTSFPSFPIHHTHPSFFTDPDTMPKLPGIQHPHFTQRNKNKYTITNPDNPGLWHVHVGQIMMYLAFDKALRDNFNVSQLPGIPLGYDNFTTAFNNRTYLHDKRLLSTYISGTSRKSDYVNKSMNPVFLQDFFITLEQCRLPPPHQ